MIIFIFHVEPSLAPDAMSSKSVFLAFRHSLFLNPSDLCTLSLFPYPSPEIGAVWDEGRVRLEGETRDVFGMRFHPGYHTRLKLAIFGTTKSEKN
ncbi:hypothetical protein PRIPAC_82528 [Pristionchus pacificus]|uniref:Uncharacterized protein n=1 Tax=Pristionchus pacificus TaxID=54126 RepID=A0A2A6C3L9_PRIPA|nr:hypothetical protein PRIPAC_82528 [Pristionchus pacificus]|eukprot:PDM72716.1 hypothetical protein PRIPAC_39150 [Pristionchus pacificus]